MERNWLQGVDMFLLMSAVLLPQKKEKAQQDTCSEMKQQLINCKTGFQGHLECHCFVSTLTCAIKFDVLLVFHALALASKIKKFFKRTVPEC